MKRALCLGKGSGVSPFRVVLKLNLPNFPSTGNLPDLSIFLVGRLRRPCPSAGNVGRSQALTALAEYAMSKVEEKPK